MSVVIAGLLALALWAASGALWLTSHAPRARRLAACGLGWGVIMLALRLGSPATGGWWALGLAVALLALSWRLTRGQNAETTRPEAA